MNEISPETNELQTEREIVIAGTAIEGAVQRLAEVAPDFNLEGKSLSDLEKEATRLEEKAAAIRSLAVHCRPDNNILGIVEGGLKVKIRELSENS
ncbi:MAG TPA: hypothetical protein VJJ80_02495 [Patescibacteria group bacterium]|nr:hypothetical protein [Patescibacteria group bacterium]